MRRNAISPSDSLGAAAEFVIAFVEQLQAALLELKVDGGELQLSNLREIDMCALADRLYALGASRVCVCYEHEDRCISIGFGAADVQEPSHGTHRPWGRGVSGGEFN